MTDFDAWGVKAFLEEYEKEITQHTRNEIYDLYVSYRKENERVSGSIISFSRRMKELGYCVKRYRVDGKLTGFYVKNQ